MAAQFGYTETYAVLVDNKLINIRSFSQFGYDGQAELYAAYGKVCGEYQVLRTVKKLPYIPFTEEQKTAANSVDLAEFLRQRGEKLERAGREYKLIYSDGSGSHDSITIRGSTWFDHKNQVGGGAIKFMQYHYGMDFPTAVQELLGQKIQNNYPVEPHKNVSHKIINELSGAVTHKEFKLPEANENMHRVFAYLIKQRYIAPEIISHFAKQHLIFEDKAHHNAVFVGVD